MRNIGAVVLAVAVGLAGLMMFGGRWQKVSVFSASLSGVGSRAPARLSTAFIENKGQWDSNVGFAVQNRGFSARFEKTAIVLNAERRHNDDTEGAVVRLVFENASDRTKLEGEKRQDGYYNFFIGRDPARWRTNVRGFASAIYRNLYDGVDLRVRREAGQLEYDVMLEPGTDLSRLAVRCEGTKNLRLDPDGSLIMETALGSISQKPPETWYALPDGGKRPAVARYSIIDGQHFGFEVPERDAELAMVIDPGLVWSTFLGGSDTEYEVGWPGAPGVDSTGVMVWGQTFSFDFPTTAGAYDTSYNGNADVYVARLSADGSRLVWSTFLGGSGGEWTGAVVRDPSGVVTIAGWTGSRDFPTTPAAYDTSYNGDIDDGYVARLNASGSALIYSTFLGGSGRDIAVGLAVDLSGIATVSGGTISPNYPTTPGAYDTSYNGGADAWATRLNATGSSLIWSTYLGGSSDDCSEDLAIQSTGEVTLSGWTVSLNFPTTPGAFDTTYNGAGSEGIGDCFVTRLNAAGSRLVWSTYLGGSQDERTPIGGVDASGAVTLAFWTTSPDFPTTRGAYDTSYNGGDDGFVARLNSTGSALVWSTFLGTPGYDCCNEAAVQANGAVSVCGYTDSPSFPTTPGAYDTTYNGGGDAFVARFNSTGSSLIYSTFLGGTGLETSWGIALDNQGVGTVVGPTRSFDFPVTPAAYDTSWNGGYDVFISRLDFIPVGIKEGSWTQPEHGRTLYLSTPLPNPTSRSISYSVHVGRKMHVRVRVFDATGRLVQILADKPLPAGLSSFTWTPDKSKIPNGTYMLRLDAGGMSQTRKFVLVK